MECGQVSTVIERALLLKLYNTNTQGGLSKQKEWKTCLAFRDSTIVERNLTWLVCCSGFVDLAVCRCSGPGQFQ